jgi:hypothetical protein
MCDLSYTGYKIIKYNIMSIIFDRLGGWGLGNSLFQIATTISIANDNNSNYYFPDNCCFIKKYKKYFKKELPTINTDIYNKIKFERWGVGIPTKYINPPPLKNAIIDGFFQTEKYFINSRNKIVDAIEIKDEYTIYLKNKYHDILNEKSCTLHVRRGDYFTAKEMKVIDTEYYKSAIKRFANDTLFVIFSDDIEWCKHNLDFITNKIFINENNDILELYLMSYFKNNIIANSTFSWWGAWLGENNKVIMPNPSNNWFSDFYYKEKELQNINCEYESIIPNNWIVI